MTRNSLPQLPHGYRYGDEHSIHPHCDGDYLAPQGYVIKSVNLVDGVVIYVPIQRYIKHLGKVRISRSFLPKLTR